MKVLLTGPSGRVGSQIVGLLREHYDLHTFDLKPSSEPNSFVGDLSEIEPLREAMRGCEAVIHLAATSDEAPFVEKLVPNNVIGLYNVFEAARLEKVRCLIFASSVQAVSFNTRGSGAVETDEAPRPSTLYGATKAWGETMGRYYYDKHGLEFIAVRIGGFQSYDSPYLKESWCQNLWLSPRDAVLLFQKAIETPNVGYAIVNGTSKTLFERLSLKSAREILGYVPQDDVRDYLPAAKP